MRELINFVRTRRTLQLSPAAGAESGRGARTFPQEIRDRTRMMRQTLSRRKPILACRACQSESARGAFATLSASLPANNLVNCRRSSLADETVTLHRAILPVLAAARPGTTACEELFEQH